jgi:hypothetical protein
MRGVKILKIFLIFFRKKKNCKDLVVDHDLSEFSKILMPEFSKKKIIFF